MRLHAAWYLGLNVFFYPEGGESRIQYLQPVCAIAVRTSNLIGQGQSLITLGGKGRCSLQSGASSTYTTFVNKVNSSLTFSEPIQTIKVLNSREPTKLRHTVKFCCLLLGSVAVGPIHSASFCVNSINGGQFNYSILCHKLVVFTLKTQTAAFIWYTSS